MKKAESISPLEVKELIQKGHGVLLLDVRSEEEYTMQHIPGAVNSSLELIEREGLNISIDTIVVTVCGKGGGRSEKAAIYIRDTYKTETCFLDGGTIGWLDEF